MRKHIFINMIRLKTLLEQASKESIRVAGKTITGKHIANTQNAADKWMYFKGDNNRYYASSKAKQSWRDLKSTLSPSNYNIASTRIEKWNTGASTPTAETPTEPNADIPSAETPTEPSAVPNADIPSAVPSKYTTTYTAGSPWKSVKWKKWNRDGYDITPGVIPPDDNTILYDSGVSAIGNTKSAVQMQLQTLLRSKGQSVLDPKIGLVAWKTAENGQIEARWLTYPV